MTTARFYVSEKALQAGRLKLAGGEHHHASRVLRMRRGESVILLDGRGCMGHGTVEAITSNHTSVIVDDTLHVPEESPRLHLFQGLPRGTRMDNVVERGVEMGVASVTPFTCSRSYLPEKSFEKRVERWRRIALEASRVAGRAYLPEITGIEPWEDMLCRLEHMDAVLFADEAGGTRPASVLKGRESDELALVIGPEGGFSSGEREGLVTAGALAVTLGSNILRAETAGMVLLAAVRCNYGLL